LSTISGGRLKRLDVMVNRRPAATHHRDWRPNRVDDDPRFGERAEGVGISSVTRLLTYFHRLYACWPGGPHAQPEAQTAATEAEATQTFNTEHPAAGQPIALSPNRLLTQTLMASTFPLQVVRADRSLAEPSNTLTSAWPFRPSDPSMKSLLPLPSGVAKDERKPRLDPAAWLCVRRPTGGGVQHAGMIAKSGADQRQPAINSGAGHADGTARGSRRARARRLVRHGRRASSPAINQWGRQSRASGQLQGPAGGSAAGRASGSGIAALTGARR
jgi:hypothetical protein